MNVYISNSGTLTLPQLERYSGSISAFLSKRGVRIAAIITGKSPLVYAAVRGCIIAGICYIPVDEALPEQRRLEILAEAEVVLCDGGKFAAEPEYIDLRSVVEFNDDDVLFPQIDPLSPAYRIYTSGTTGTPKGIEVTYGNVGNFLRWFMSIPAIAEEKPRSVLNQAMFSFDLSVADLYYSLFTGAKLTVIERGLWQDFNGMVEMIRESHAELAVFTPAFAELCMCDKSFCRELLPELRVIFFCGEVLKPRTAEKLFRRFPGVRIINAYGPTECCCAVTAAEITPEMTVSTLPVGDMSHTAGEVAVEDGEIVIYGGSVARYTGKEQGGFADTEQRRCFHTGDKGSIRAGMLYFHGRLDRQVKIMGFRIEPEDIENNLLKIPGVLQAVVAVSDRGSRKTLAAEVVTDGSITSEEIHCELSGAVPEYMIPRRISIVDRIAVSMNGKVERQGKS